MSVLQAIEIAPEWHENVNQEIKRITIRKGERNYAFGRTMLCCPKTSWCVEREVVSVDIIPLREVKDEDVKADGFRNLDDLFSKLEEYYPDVSYDDLMTVVKWK